MSKPWEQEWSVDPNSPDFVVDVGPRYATVAKAMALWPMDVATHQQVTGELAKFISAAPDMARALLDVASEDASLSVDGMPCWCTRQGRERMRDSGIIRHEGFCDRARAALRKAGVIP